MTFDVCLVAAYHWGCVMFGGQCHWSVCLLPRVPQCQCTGLLQKFYPSGTVHMLFHFYFSSDFTAMCIVVVVKLSFFRMLVSICTI